MKFKNCLVWAIKAKYFHTVLKLINVERLFSKYNGTYCTSNIAQHLILGSRSSALNKSNAELSLLKL